MVLATICSSVLALVSLSAVAEAGKPIPPLYSGGAPTSAPVLFILCNWGSGFSYHPNSLGYYQTLWTKPTSFGYKSLADYWRQVSFGQTNINGSNVLHGPHSKGGWYSMSLGASPISPVTYAGYGGGGSPQRIDRILACMNAASIDLAAAHLAKYQSVVTVTPYVQATAPGAISEGATSIPLSSVSAWPSAKFDINYTPPGGGRNFTDVLVSSIDTATKTLHLAAPWSLGPVKAGALITSVTSDDVGWVGPRTIWENGSGVFNTSGAGTAYRLGVADISAGDPAHGSTTNGVGDGAHEVGHSFGYSHSRAMASSITDYYDCWDQMSYDTCSSKSPVTVAPPNDGAIGMDAIDLENQGWIPKSARYIYSSGQHTIKLHALSDPNALKTKGVLLDAHIPAVVTIEDGAPSGFSPSVPPTCSGAGYHCDNSDYFTVEYRQPVGPHGVQTWDYGAGALAGRTPWVGAVVLHLHTPVANPTGGNSFLVNTNLDASSLVKLSYNGGLAPSFSPTQDEFTDTHTHTYVVVNAISPKTWTATVTISSKPIAAAIAYTGQTTATYGQKVVLSGRVTVVGSGAPVPNEPVEFGVTPGVRCETKTNLAGVAACTVSTKLLATLSRSFHVSGLLLGDAAYGGAHMATRSLTISTAPVTGTAHPAPGQRAFGPPGRGPLYVLVDKGSNR